MNPLFFNTLYMLLSAKCTSCHGFRITAVDRIKYIGRLRLLDAGLVYEAQHVASMEPIEKAHVIAEPTKEEGNSTIEIDGGAGDSADTAVEDSAAFVKRVRDHVEAALANAENNQTSVPHMAVVKRAQGRCSRVYASQSESQRIATRVACRYIKYRKDGVVEIFQIALSTSAQATAVQRQASVDQVSGLKLDIQTEKTEKPNGPQDGGDAASGDEMQVDSTENTPAKSHGNTFLSTACVREHMRALFTKESEILQLLFGGSNFSDVNCVADMFFLDVLAVPPSRFRPPSVLNDVVYENGQNDHFSKILIFVPKH